MTGTAVPTPIPPTSPHTEVATRLLDGRVSAAGPAVSPDGQRIAFIVATIDLAENTTTTRVWLAGPTGDPAPITAGPHDAGPVWSPDGRWLAFGSRRGEKDKEATLHVLPVDGPGEVRTVVAMPDGIADVAWSPDGKWLAFTSRTRDARYEAKDERWQSPRKIETFFSRLDNVGLGVRPPPARARRRRRRHRRRAQPDPRPLPAPRRVVAGRLLRRRHRAPPATTAGTATWPRTSTSCPLDGPIRALTKQTGTYGHPAVSPDGSTVAFLGADDPGVDPQNAKIGVVALSGGGHRWISDRPRPHVHPDRRRAGPGLARRRRRCWPPPRIAATRTSTASPPTGRRRPSRSPADR